MPPLLALVPLLVGGGQPSAPKPSTPTPAQTAAQALEVQNSEKAAIGQQAPNIISSTSGLANPDYVAQISQLLSGTANSPGASGAAKSVIQQLFGLSGGGGGTGGGGGFTPAGPASTSNSAAPTNENLTDFANQFF